MPIIDTPAGTLEVQNAILSASEFRATQKISVANSAPTKTFSVGDKLHVSTTDLDAVSISGNLVAQKVKVGNLLVSPSFDLASVSNVGNTTSNIIQFANATTGFTTTANVEIGGNITLTANAQVKVGSNVLAEYTGPHGRDPKEVPLKKYPEIVFDASKMDRNDTTNTYTQAGYTVTADSQITECKAYKAFDNKFFVNGSDLNRWQTGNHGYYGSTADTTTGPVTTLADSTTKRGSYIQLESPHKIIVSRYVIWAQENANLFRPKKVILLGSNTGGTDWVSIDPAGEVEPEFVSTGAGPTISTMATVSFTNTTAYKYHRLVVRANNGGTVVLVQELELYGRDEPSETSGDLSLDTTIKSTFNSVRSNNYVMYFDGDEFIPGDNNSNNLVTGSSVSVVHHNATYDSTGKYWTLNGSTESNVTTGDLGFEGDAPHTVSMWVNSSNLDANASTQQLFTIGSGYDKSFLEVDDTQIAANTWHNVTYAYQGEGGSKVTYMDGRKVEEVPVEDTLGLYPPFPMTDYRVGGYVLSTDADHDGTAKIWKAFDRDDSAGSAWFSQPGSGDGLSSYQAGFARGNPGQNVTDTNGTTHSGSWGKIEFPFKFVLNHIRIHGGTPVADYVPHNPENYVILGSNDDTNWDLLTTRTGVNDGNNGMITGGTNIEQHAVNATKGYKYIKFLVTKLGSTSGDREFIIVSLKLYGHKEGDLTRFPEPTRVLKYPHITMTGYAQRGYVVTASNETLADGNRAWHIFDENDSTFWKSDERYNSSGAETTSSGLTDTSSTAHGGEYVILESPNKLKITGFNLTRDGGTTARSPGSIALLGKNSAPTVTTGWTLIAQQTTSTYTNNVAPLTISGNSNYFKYHAVVIRSIDGNGLRFHIKNIELLGTEEDTQTPAIVGGPFAGKVANFRVYDQYLGEERIQEIYDAQKDVFGHKKSSMTFYKGRVGVGTTEPEGALAVLDEPHTLEMFPAHELVSNDTHIDGQGIIKVSSSYRGENDRSLGTNDHALRTDVHAYRAFMSDRNWISVPERNTRMSEEVDYGAWLKIQTPQSISLKKAKIESNPYWQQIGSDIFGSQAATNLGISVDCTHDGTRIIAGSYQTSSSPIGEVRVYDWDGSTWVQVGNTITGGQSSPTQGYLGYTVAISGDGNTIAAGTPFEDPDGNTDRGVVRVFYLNGSTWTILPDSGSETTNIGTNSSSLRNDVFVGSSNSDQLGRQGLKLSYDGKTILMTARNYDDATAGTDAGQARIYTYSNGAWSKKGDFLVGSADDHLGYAADMSEDGNCIILGGAWSGARSAAWIYIWNGSTWVNRGASGTNPAFSRTDQDGFGQAVAINNDGTVIAFGLVNGDIADGALSDNGGIVQVYHWTGSAWAQAGNLYNKDNTDDEFGSSVNLSGDGKRIIVGARDDSTTSANNGRLYTWEYDDSSQNWFRREPYTSIGISSTVSDDTEIGHTPRCVAISRDGSAIVSGEFRFNSSNGSDSGRVRIFSMPSNIKSIWGSNDDKNWTKITTAPTREEATSNVAGIAFRYTNHIEIKNLDNPNYYKYHAIVADAYTTLKNVRLYGIREKASSTIHDGTLTLTKNLIVPRIGPAFDTDDTPRRDRLVVEYTTSTSPVEYGYVKDTSGNGYNAKMVGVVYNPSDKSFECSANDATQWIETYIPNGSRFNTQFSMSVWANMGQFDLSSLYGFIFGLGDRTQTGLSSTSGNEISLVYNHAGLAEGTFYASIEGQNLIFKEWTTHNSHMGQWYHLAMTYDGSTLYVYKNGENAGYGARTAPVLPDENCVVRLFGDSVNENATHQGRQSRISNFKLYDCCLTRDEVRTLYNMGRCDEGHHVVSFEKTRVGIGLGDSSAPKAELDVRGTARIGPSGQQWRTSGDDADRLIQFHSGQAAQGSPTLEVTHYGGTRASPTPTVLQISNELGGGSDWSTTEPYALLSFATADGSGSGVGGPAASVGAVCDTGSGGGDTRLAFFTNSGVDHDERMCIDHNGNVGVGSTTPHAPLTVFGVGGSLTGGNARTYFYYGISPVTSGSGWSSSVNSDDLGIFSNKTIATNNSIISMNGTLGASDERIKKEIVDVEDDEALTTIRLLKPKRYKYRDEAARGSDPVWGFIAQEVRDTLPYATQTRRECIPNIYETANVSVSNVITFTNFDTSDLESNAMVLKVFDKDDTEHLINIAEVVDDHSVRVEENLSEWTGSVDESGNVVAGNQLFVYGQRVDDFVFLRKESIWTVATAALQEVDRQLQAEKAKVTTLETQVADLLARVQTLESA